MRSWRPVPARPGARWPTSMLHFIPRRPGSPGLEPKWIENAGRKRPATVQSLLTGSAAFDKAVEGPCHINLRAMQQGAVVGIPAERISDEGGNRSEKIRLLSRDVPAGTRSSGDPIVDVELSSPITPITVKYQLSQFVEVFGCRPHMDVRASAEAGVRKPSGEEAAGRPMGVSGWAALWGFQRRWRDDVDCVAAMSAFRAPMIYAHSRLIDALARQVRLSGRF